MAYLLENPLELVAQCVFTPILAKDDDGDNDGFIYIGGARQLIPLLGGLSHF